MSQALHQTDIAIIGAGPVGLFAVSRCAGWIAHALEQYQAGYLLRPRARYSES